MKSPPRTPKRTVVAFLALCALGSAACVKQDPPGVGLVKFDSSAVFGLPPEDEEPVVPNFSVPEEAFVAGSVILPNRPPVTQVKSEGPCPAAKLTAFPKGPATVQVKDMPAAGVYKWKRNLLAIKDATRNPPQFLNRPFALEGRAIRRVARDSDHQFRFEMLSPDPLTNGNTIITSFRVNTNPELVAERTIGTETIGVVNTPGSDVRVVNPQDAPGIFITEIERQDAQGVRVSRFTPVQPMLIVPLEGGILRSGQTFRSVGIDASTGTAITNDGVVGRTSRVDACGEIVEGYTVTLHQTLTSDSQEDSPDDAASKVATREETREVTYTFATQYGALPIAETLALGDINVDPVAAIGKWELGGLAPAPLPDALK